MESKKRSIYEIEPNYKQERMLSGLLLMILNPIILILSVLIYERSYENIIKMGLLGILTGIILLFVFLTSHLKEQEYNNNNNSLRFVLVYLICLSMVCIFPLIPNLLWPFLPLTLVCFFIRMQ
jgi:hypothetical protein